MPKKFTGKTMNNNSDYVWDIYEITPKMSTYTIAMSVLSTNYTPIVRQTGKRNISVTSIEYDKDTSERMLSTTIKFINFFENYFNNTDNSRKLTIYMP